MSLRPPPLQLEGVPVTLHAPGPGPTHPSYPSRNRLPGGPFCGLALFRLEPAGPTRGHVPVAASVAAAGRAAVYTMLPRRARDRRQLGFVLLLETAGYLDIYDSYCAYRYP